MLGKKKKKKKQEPIQSHGVFMANGETVWVPIQWHRALDLTVRNAMDSEFDETVSYIGRTGTCEDKGRLELEIKVTRRDA